MTARAAIKQSDLRRMAAIAKAQGVRVEIEIDGKIIRVAPDNNEGLEIPTPVRGNGLSSWRARHESGSGGNPPRQKGTR